MLGHRATATARQPAEGRLLGSRRRDDCSAAGGGGACSVAGEGTPAQHPLAVRSARASATRPQVGVADTRARDEHRACVTKERRPARNRLGRGWLTARARERRLVRPTGIAGLSGRRESLARPAPGNRWPVQPPGIAGPSSPRESLARPAARVGMKGAGVLREPGRSKHWRRAKRAEARSEVPARRAGTSKSRRLARPGTEARRGLSSGYCGDRAVEERAGGFQRGSRC